MDDVCLNGPVLEATPQIFKGFISAVCSPVRIAHNVAVPAKFRQCSLRLAVARLAGTADPVLSSSSPIVAALLQRQKCVSEGTKEIAWEVSVPIA